MTKQLIVIALLILVALPFSTAFAQEDTTEDNPVNPPSYLLNGFTYHAQGWNNCGPATLTMGLSYFGYEDNQTRAATWLKPNGEDKNVSPWQMVEYVNTQVPEIPVYAMLRYGGTLDHLRTLVSNGFPVIIEAGYDPVSAGQGWMGHYLLVIGYDDARQVLVTHDSYDGANLEYSYEHIEEFWQHFNYAYIPIYLLDREAELLSLLGADADERENKLNAFEMAREQAIENPDDSFAWFNMGSMLVELEFYEDAAVAYDQARNVGAGLPWRMLWYQFGPYEAYNAVGRYDETLQLANQVRNDGGGHFVEETFYYAAVARAGLGEVERAIDNLNAVLNFNPNFAPARELRAELQG